MITEATRQRIDSNVTEDRKKWCRDVIDAAARYERLAAHKDFQDVLKDLQRDFDSLAHNIGVATIEMSLQDNPQGKAELSNFITRQTAQRELVGRWLQYPSYIVDKAVKCRQELDQIKQKENTHA